MVFVCASSLICYTLPLIVRRSFGEEVSGVHSMVADLPQGAVLNRGIAKLIDLFIVVAAGQIIVPVGFLEMAYILVADGFAGGRSIGIAG